MDNKISYLNEICKNTLIGHLGIEFIEYSENTIKARMPVDNRTIQPMKILHGGASVALAESVGGAGSLMMIDTTRYNVVGMQINANHVGSPSEGYVYALGQLFHRGSKTHIWDVTITDDKDNKVSVCRVTNMIIEKD